MCVICTQESLDLVTILLWVCKTTSSISHFCVSLLYFCKMDIMILFASQEWQGTLVLVYSVLTCSRSAIEKWSVNWFMNCQPCIKNRFNISILSELTQKKAITYDKVGRSGVFLLKCTQMLIIVQTFITNYHSLEASKTNFSTSQTKVSSTDCYAHITYTL